MPTDTSDASVGSRAEWARKHSAGPEAEYSAVDNGAALDAPACSLKFRGSLFGSTLAKVFSAVDQVGVGETVSICTNDP